MFVVDASVWIAGFWPEDRHHNESRSWLTEVISRGEKTLSPAVVLAEIAGPIARLSGDSARSLQIVEDIVRLPGFELAVVTEELAVASAQVAADLRLKGADAIYVAVAIERSVPLITFDNEQLVRGRQLVETAIPTREGPF